MRYFALSDVHSCLRAMSSALGKAGYDPFDPDDFLVFCGDMLDRGPEPEVTIGFLRSLPKDRRALIVGNHEDLLRDAVSRGRLESWDCSNGTADTVRALSGIWGLGGLGSPQVRDVCAWTDGPDWLDYFEAGPFTFVHSFVPVASDPSDPDAVYLGRTDRLRPVAGWRDEPPKGADWREARWGCPWRMHRAGLFPDAGRVLVCGHWAASDFHRELEGVAGDDGIYCGPGLIALDGTAARSGRVNVLVVSSDGWTCADGLTGEALDPFSGMAGQSSGEYHMLKDGEQR